MILTLTKKIQLAGSAVLSAVRYHDDTACRMSASSVHSCSNCVVAVLMGDVLLHSTKIEAVLWLEMLVSVSHLCEHYILHSVLPQPD